jgi:hypothetical protein
MQMDEGLDTGPMRRNAVSIGPTTAPQLSERLSQQRQNVETLEMVDAGTFLQLHRMTKSRLWHRSSNARMRVLTGVWRRMKSSTGCVVLLHSLAATLSTESTVWKSLPHWHQRRWTPGYLVIVPAAP